MRPAFRTGAPRRARACIAPRVSANDTIAGSDRPSPGPRESVVSYLGFARKGRKMRLALNVVVVTSLAFFLTSLCLASDISYDVDLTIGAGTATGDILT